MKVHYCEWTTFSWTHQSSNGISIHPWKIDLPVLLKVLLLLFVFAALDADANTADDNQQTDTGDYGVDGPIRHCQGADKYIGG